MTQNLLLTYRRIALLPVPVCQCGDCGLDAYLQDEDGDRFYKCQTCGRSVPWCFGAADAMPGSCDDCWFATVFQEASDNEEATINV